MLHLLVRTNNAVLLSYVQSLLADESIEAVVFDENISIVEGLIDIFPRRVMVHTEDVSRARHVLWEAGLAAELAPWPSA